MTTLAKTLLVISATGFAVGSLIDFGGFNVIPAATVAMPLGAVFSGLFGISVMMEKEMAAYDEETARNARLTERPAAAPAPARAPASKFTTVSAA